MGAALAGLETARATADEATARATLSECERIRKIGRSRVSTDEATVCVREPSR
jgi:hypothetical protein